MIRALATLLLFQALGETLRVAFALPVPGPVIGMALLAAWLLLRPAEAAALRDTSQGLLRHLSLLFVPAGVGVMLHAGRLADEGLAIAAALVVSTVASIAATALTVRWVRRALGD